MKPLHITLCCFITAALTGVIVETYDSALLTGVQDKLDSANLKLSEAQSTVSNQQALLAEQDKLNESTRASLDKCLATLDNLADLTNLMVDELWNMPIDQILYLRESPQPKPLSSHIEGYIPPLNLPEGKISYEAY